MVFAKNPVKSIIPYGSYQENAYFSIFGAHMSVKNGLCLVTLDFI